MGETDEEELAPLFDYSRVHPAGINCLSDEDSDVSPLFLKGNRKRSHKWTKSRGEKVKNAQEVVNILDEEEEEENRRKKKNDEEEDWLPPPPKVPRIGLVGLEDKILQELRCTKLELASLAQEAKDLLNTMTESGERDIRIVEKSAMEVKEDEPTKKVEREKIVISIQDKGGCKQFRVYMDENFERLFKMYAEKLKLKLETLVFSFDGERVNPSSTPAALGLENDDIIEVNFKAC
ncbi:hypothetical protein HPP92_004850 [Vanilla planifolia]|uniref:Rad60/SUMO-like domain-containing protein n=1 Tax=Vanilla planifolia TaxID=51239 RepID=A0A835VAF3_VANPL|nr:hypothetical protein HPP92_004850 [Vanilla planifolia]